MSQDWAERTAEQLLGRGLLQTGKCLILGAADTGKTTLAAALAKRAASSEPVAIIDADIGQSHIGPPTTVGWAVLDNPQLDFSALAVRGISFVGDVTPVGHLLQLTAAILQCVEQASKAAKLCLIDTPGLVYGPASSALWWTVQRVLKPESILAVQRDDELNDILVGLRSLDLQLELVICPEQIPLKSRESRRSYRQRQFGEYFRSSCHYDINLSNVAVQSGRLSREGLAGRVVALRDGKGVDVAIGIVADWKDDREIVVIRAPQVDIQRIRCLVIGDVTLRGDLD